MTTTTTEVAPGVRHDLTTDEYHAITDWYSSSQLKAALPERYKTGGNQAALDFGTLFHSLVLEPDTVEETIVVLDAAQIAGTNPKTKRPYDSPTATKKYREAVAEATAAGKTVVDPADWDKARAMADAVTRHDTASKLLHAPDRVTEESAFAIDDDGIRHKARFDCRIPGAIVDLKSTAGRVGRDAITRTILDFGYEVSAQHYLAVARLLGLDVQAFALVFVTKTDPYRVTVAELDESILARGAALRRQALDRLTNPAAPAYEGATGFLTITAPRWAQLEETA